MPMHFSALINFFMVVWAVVVLFCCLYRPICLLLWKLFEELLLDNPPNDLEANRYHHDWRNLGVNDEPLTLPPVLAPYRTPVQAVADAVAYDGQEKTKFVNDECVICLAGFEDGEVCHVLVNCKHVYHRECIDEWMSRKSCCPICRVDAAVSVRVSNSSEPLVT